MLELKHIHKYYNAGTVNEMCLFNDFNLTIEDHQFVSVVGSNGSGKTSLLNIICGSIPLDDGRIIIGGEDITKMLEPTNSAWNSTANLSAPLALDWKIKWT